MACLKTLTKISEFKQKALHWASQFDVCCFLDSNGYPDKYGKFDFAIAIGASAECIVKAQNALSQLENFSKLHKTWLFGFLGYDLKNEIEALESKNDDSLGFPPLYFFVPEYLIISKNNAIEVILGNKTVLNEIYSTKLPPKKEIQQIILKNRLSETDYLKKVESLKQHITKGDIYEVNFCQEFFAENAYIDPVGCFERLKQISPNPFSGYFKIYDKFILSASPERFIAKRKTKLIIQPIKGTAKRSKNAFEDEQLKFNLQANVKERAENVMIVDLSRNDLTKVCENASVQVEELFKIYSFPQVHQMISTVSGNCNPNLDLVDVIKGTFPMGSMTGAPKLRAMELIEKYESTKRGAFSGSIGYITPENDFDFSVLIRSILYNANARYLSFQVGGAITFLSDPKNEYQECLLKASALFETLKVDVQNQNE